MPSSIYPGHWCHKYTLPNPVPPCAGWRERSWQETSWWGEIFVVETLVHGMLSLSNALVSFVYLFLLCNFAQPLTLYSIWSHFFRQMWPPKILRACCPVWWKYDNLWSRVQCGLHLSRLPHRRRGFNLFGLRALVPSGTLYRSSCNMFSKSCCNFGAFCCLQQFVLYLFVGIVVLLISTVLLCRGYLPWSRVSDLWWEEASLWSILLWIKHHLHMWCWLWNAWPTCSAVHGKWNTEHWKTKLCQAR